ncbi:hypothetical protein [Pumilibacter muris]|uniref:hypothetical protein n=1 Tax=Pumilibacter muris TaxID=2941510 RepID=UPI002040C46A|nr:hypothetical protein [Pumilibacter muris]
MSSKIFDKIKGGKAASAIKSGTHAPSQDRGVAAHSLQITHIADIGTQTTITSNATM